MGEELFIELYTILFSEQQLEMDLQGLRRCCRSVNNSIEDATALFMPQLKDDEYRTLCGNHNLSVRNLASQVEEYSRRLIGALERLQSP